MARYRYTYVNAFTDQTFGGNPCMVFFGADDIDEETRLAITRESRLSECAFLQASDKADFGVRYYLPNGPIPMAGHPTLATGVALMDAGAVAAGQSFTLEVGAGVMAIDTAKGEAGAGAPNRVTMTQFAPVFGARYDRAEVAALYGLEPDDLAADPQTVGTGTPQLMAPLVSREALYRAQIDRPRFCAWAQGKDFHGAAHLFAMGGESDAGDTCARHMLEVDSPPEDPFTGSSTGGMAAWLWANGWLEAPRFIAEQGAHMGRPGRADVEVLGPRDGMTGVRVGGPGVVLMRGEIEL